MSELFVWDKLLETGDPKIDAQHQRIIALANEIITDLEPEDVKLRVLEIYRHTREHFLHEEKLMQDREFPGFLDHRQEHNAMLSRLNALVATFDATGEDCARLRQFVGGWVEEHVFHHDRIMAEFLRQ